MTVRELIALLGDVDPEMEVMVDDRAAGGLYAPELRIMDPAREGDLPRCLLITTPGMDHYLGEHLARPDAG